MNPEEGLPPQVKYWLSPHTKHDCYFKFECESGPTERVGAFKAFLMGYSEPFRAMLQDSDLNEKGDICIVDFHPNTFREFLKCLYMGFSDDVIGNLSFQTSVDLLYVSDKYLVSQLKDKLIKQCINTLLPDVSCINVACANQVFLQETSLLLKLIEVVKIHVKCIINSEKLYEITKDSLVWILGLDPLDIDELSLWLAVLSWAKMKTNSNDGVIIRGCILEMLEYIRFCSMKVHDFCEHVVPTDVLTDEEVKQICKYYGTKEKPSMKFICNNNTRRRTTVECFRLLEEEIIDRIELEELIPTHTARDITLHYNWLAFKV